MSAMARNDSANSIQGFSIYQPELGDSLQFLPALGTQQLDDLINAYLPGPASIQDKRAAVTIDFCDFAGRTGQNLKYYPVFAFDSVSSSPASAHDSGYGSSFNASPAISNWGWNQASATSSPSAQTAAQFAPRRVSTSSTSRPRPTDFSDLPGMKIMTRDGRDVTNSASRGCKTKAQRDHAHLMRIMKACEACRRKKIRCDPSHRNGASAKPEPQTRPVRAAQPAARAPQIAHAPTASPEYLLDLSVSAQAGPSSHAQDVDRFEAVERDGWDEFFAFDQDLPDILPHDYDFFSDPDGHFSPAYTTASSSSPGQPRTPPADAVAALGIPAEMKVPELAGHLPTLPYLDRNGPAHEYVDFSLYSPASSFSDEDLFGPQDIGSTRNSRATANFSPFPSAAQGPASAMSFGGANGAEACGDTTGGDFFAVASTSDPGTAALRDDDRGWDSTANSGAQRARADGNAIPLGEREYTSDVIYQTKTSQLHQAAASSQTITSSQASPSTMAISDAKSRPTIGKLDDRQCRTERKQNALSPSSSLRRLAESSPAVASPTIADASGSQHLAEHSHLLAGQDYRLTVVAAPSRGFIDTQSSKPRLLSAASVSSHRDSSSWSRMVRPTGTIVGESGDRLAPTTLLQEHSGTQGVAWTLIAISAVGALVHGASKKFHLGMDGVEGDNGLGHFLTVSLLGLLALATSSLQALAATEPNIKPNSHEIDVSEETVKFSRAPSGPLTVSTAYVTMSRKPRSSGHGRSMVSGTVSGLSTMAVSKVLGGLQSGFQRFAGHISDIQCRVSRRLNSSGLRPDPRSSRVSQLGFGHNSG